MTHYLKIEKDHFIAVKQYKKKAEMRRNDRGFEVDDEIILCEIENGVETGEKWHVYITHIQTGMQYGIADGFAMLSIEF
ncbi:DUF3850 domain-containing protein [Sulfurimonas sp. HSL-1656]|uniref:DUF3850 domain-containing protein n=1 Tax=Thiomicrolovo subterrani TaxID=3131934 RepID=UPI0031FA3D71